MTKPLSERINEARQGLVYGPALIELLDEAIDLARRVEEAAVATLQVGQHGGQSIHLRDADPEVLMLKGRRVALVPVEGGA